MNRGKTIAIIGVLGILTYMKFGKTLGFNAENSKGMKTIVKRIEHWLGIPSYMYRHFLSPLNDHL